MTAHSDATHAHGHMHSEPTADEVVRVSCVRHSYEDGTSVHLCGIDFVAARGTRTVLLGPNGSGKTTLLFHVLGLLRSQEGTVRVFGVDPAVEWSAIRSRIGVVLQNVDEQLLMPTVFDDVAFSPRQFGLGEAEVATRVQAALDLLGIAKLADRVPHDLSGGEKRKVALAGALVMEPELLVLDEPFEGLDPAAREGLVALIERLAHEKQVTVVMSTHDIDSVHELAERAYVLKPGGEIALSGTPAEVFANADVLARSNIKPPILAELFAELAERDSSAPGPALSVDEAARVLAQWKDGGSAG
ncbi:MAG: ABC transporter ATP-binding protein [Coriobacteriia bacterium]|nr:ABC transporter ATP-binding protein [Coriobacteriia bacterium]